MGEGHGTGGAESAKMSLLIHCGFLTGKYSPAKKEGTCISQKKRNGSGRCTGLLGSKRWSKLSYASRNNEQWKKKGVESSEKPKSRDPRVWTSYRLIVEVEKTQG